MILLDEYYINKKKINYFYTYRQCNMFNSGYVIKINFDKDNFITCSFTNKEDFEKALKLLNE